MALANAEDLSLMKGDESRGCTCHQQWLSEAELDYSYITGGYKALRHCLLTVLTQCAE